MTQLFTAKEARGLSDIINFDRYGPALEHVLAYIKQAALEGNTRKKISIIEPKQLNYIMSNLKKLGFECDSPDENYSFYVNW